MPWLCLYNIWMCMLVVSSFQFPYGYYLVDPLPAFLFFGYYDSCAFSCNAIHHCHIISVCPIHLIFHGTSFLPWGKNLMVCSLNCCRYSSLITVCCNHCIFMQFGMLCVLHQCLCSYLVFHHLCFPCGFVSTASLLWTDLVQVCWLFFSVLMNSK